MQEAVYCIYSIETSVFMIMQRNGNK